MSLRGVHELDHTVLLGRGPGARPDGTARGNPAPPTSSSTSASRLPRWTSATPNRPPRGCPSSVIRRTTSSSSTPNTDRIGPDRLGPAPGERRGPGTRPPEPPRPRASPAGAGPGRLRPGALRLGRPSSARVRSVTRRTASTAGSGRPAWTQWPLSCAVARPLHPESPSHLPRPVPRPARAPGHRCTRPSLQAGEPVGPLHRKVSGGADLGVAFEGGEEVRLALPGRARSVRPGPDRGPRAPARAGGRPPPEADDRTAAPARAGSGPGRGSQNPRPRSQASRSSVRCRAFPVLHGPSVRESTTTPSRR
ncbi:hypothetical protein SUDANB121_02293 [Nocardiopsis dassonvillei]